MKTRFTSNIQKGGALLDDTRRVISSWDPDLDAATNLARIAEQNLLGKTSRARSDDVLLRIMRPRFVDPGAHVIAALTHLLDDQRAFTEACYFEASRDDALLAAYAEGPVFERYHDGRVGVTIDETTGWLARLTASGETPAWSESVQTKIARGLLAALRDFGILHGAVHKEFEPPFLSPRGFAYVAFRLHEQGASSRALAESPVWRRWLLEPARVLELFHQADDRGVLRFAQAGSIIRVDWLAGSLEEVAGAAA